MLANCGHFDTEIDVTALRACAASSKRLGDTLEQFHMPDGRSLTLLSGGRMVNLAGAEPKGNSIEFDGPWLHASGPLAQSRRDGADTLDRGPQPVPTDINETIARRMLVAMGANC